jgi:hypothetical protein
MPVQGSCDLHVSGEGDWVLEQGEVVIFRKELDHSMNPVKVSNASNTPHRPSSALRGHQYVVRFY